MVPGPFWASLTRLWLAHLSWNGKTHHVIPALHKRYGKFVRIAPNEVSVADPATLRQIYSLWHGAGNGFRKSGWYSVWQGHRKFDLFAERDEGVHGNQRALVSNTYSMLSIRQLEEYVEDAVKHFFERMENLRNQPIDMARWLQLFAFDVIGEVTFSRRFGLLDSGKDDESFNAIHRAFRSGSWIGQVPWLFWFHDRVSRYIGNHLAINARHGSVRSFAINQVNARRERGSDHDDIVGKLMSQRDREGSKLDDTAIMSMVTTNIFAGSDTTACAARAVLYFLLKHPQFKDKLIRELDMRWIAGNLSNPVKAKEADDMPYLQAVLYESLRCSPSIGLSLPRIVPEGGLKAAEYFFPAGTIVGANAWAIHREKTVFGSDAENFNPDRWLQNDISEMHRCFFTFGGGSRICMGRHLAWMELSKLLPTLFLRYNIELVDPGIEWTTQSWFIVLQKNIMVQLTPRNIGAMCK